MSVNGRLLNGCTHHPSSLLVNRTMRWLGWAPLTRPATGASTPGPPASAFGMVVNSIEGATVGEPQEIANRHTNDDVASASSVRKRLVMAGRRGRNSHFNAPGNAGAISIRGASPSASPTRSLARRFAGSLRSRGSLAVLARTEEAGHHENSCSMKSRGPRVRKRVAFHTFGWRRRCDVSVCDGGRSNAVQRRPACHL
jgi:hypothetical protein